MKKLSAVVLVALLVVNLLPGACASELSVDLMSESAILVEAETGKVLFEKNADVPRSPASVTKVMTLLLIFEAISNNKISLSDTVTASEYAASMGGSQIFLSAGESMSVEDMIKSVVISSANDAATALAEHIAGSEGAFVDMMNKKAKDLGMVNSHFENVNGLDDTTVNHKTSARDIAIMSSELIIKHPEILGYSGIWMDTIRNGTFGLTNTNRLIRFYNGATGLKTGSTSKAGFCISATAERNGTKLIAVIMAAPTRDVRNAEAKALLDYGFSNFETYRSDGGVLNDIPMSGGIVSFINASYSSAIMVLPKGEGTGVVKNVTVYDNLKAPIKQGDIVGKVTYSYKGDVLKEYDIVSDIDSPKIKFSDLFFKVFSKFCTVD